MEFLIPVSVFTEIMRFGKSAKFFSYSIWADIMEHDALQRATKDYPHPTQGVWIVKDSFVSKFTNLTKVYLTFLYEGITCGTSAIYDYNEKGEVVWHNANEASAKLNLLPQVEQLEFFKQKANQLSGWLNAIWALPKERLTAALGVSPERHLRTEYILALQERNLLHPDGIAALFPELSPKPTQANLQWEWDDGEKWDLCLRLETGEWNDLGLNMISGLCDRKYSNYRI
ncbi:MAG: hypothetical protein ACK48P_01755 [Holosporales bacterium]